jgi:hypothetical protein
MPMRSRRQWNWAFAAGMPFARRWAHVTRTKFKRLPLRKGPAPRTRGGRFPTLRQAAAAQRRRRR